MNHLKAALAFSAWVAIAAIGLGGCALTGAPALEVPSAPGTGAPATPGDYLIGPGDQLSVVVWRSPEISTLAPVRPDGKITTPLVEDMPATGKTPTQLARDIEKALAKYVREPVVSVVVMGFVGPYSEQVRVIGEAVKPQALPYRASMTLLDVMLAVGGISEFAAGNRAVLIRSGTKQQFSIRLHDLIRRGDLSANVEIRPGDVILIPQSLF
jgi:polysaccharide export outer membrane protein